MNAGVRRAKETMIKITGLCIVTTATALLSSCSPDSAMQSPVTPERLQALHEQILQTQDDIIVARRSLRSGVRRSSETTNMQEYINPYISNQLVELEIKLNRQEKEFTDLSVRK
jgi:hypothetical protein